MPAMLLAASSAVAAGLADDGYGDDPTVPLAYPFEAAAPTPRHDRPFDLTFGLRLRAVSVPKGLLDVWFFDDDDQDWAYIEPRPRVRGTAFGLELGLRRPNSQGIFYAEFVDAGLADGYWDDVENPAEHLDGEYLAPSAGLGLVAFGLNYAAEIHALRTEDTGGRFGASFLVGGGLGLGVLVGELDRWGPDNQGNPGYKRYLDGLPPDDDKNLPRVFPMVDINVAVRADFGSRVLWQLEGGLHTMLYYGTSLAVVF